MNESQMRKEWISAMFDSSYKMDAEATLEWWLSQFQQYKALLLSQIEEVRKPNPTDSWEKEFDNFVSINELYPKGADVGKLKSFISEVRQKAVDEAYKLGVEHGRNGTIITQD